MFNFLIMNNATSLIAIWKKHYLIFKKIEREKRNIIFFVLLLIEVVLKFIVCIK